MDNNSYGFSTPRALALVTVTATLILGVTSGVFSTFYPALQSGKTCSFGYGYDNSYGYGYGYGDASGYDCIDIPVVTVVTSAGGGSAGSAGTPSTPLSPPAVVALAKEVIVLAKDINSSEFKSAIQTLIQAGVINNVSRINPDKTITRGEFLKLLALSNGYKAPAKIAKRFVDVPPKHSLVNYINYGVIMGWVNVRKDTFRPNDIITQGEIDKLILAIKKLATADTLAKKSPSVSRGKAIKDIVDAFYTK